MFGLRNAVNENKIPENANPDKVIDIVEKCLDFNKQQKSKRLKTLTTKQMFQRLPIALAKVKVGNISENLLNEIRQIKYSLHRPNLITKRIMLQYNEFNTVIIQNGYYLYEFWKS